MSERRTVRAIENHCEPSVSSITCVKMRPGSAKVACRFHKGQVPPELAKGNRLEENRFETLPAISTRTRKNGTPRAVGRASVVRRCATCSKLAPKRAAKNLDIIAGELGRLMETAIRHHHGAGEIIGERDAQQAGGSNHRLGSSRAEIIVQKIAELAEGQLIGRLKRPPRLLDDLRDHQLAAVMIIPAQPVAHDLERQTAHADSMARAKLFAQARRKDRGR